MDGDGQGHSGTVPGKAMGDGLGLGLGDGSGDARGGRIGAGVMVSTGGEPKGGSGGGTGTCAMPEVKSGRLVQAAVIFKIDIVNASMRKHDRRSRFMPLPLAPALPSGYAAPAGRVQRASSLFLPGGKFRFLLPSRDFRKWSPAAGFFH